MGGLTALTVTLESLLKNGALKALGVVGEVSVG